MNYYQHLKKINNLGNGGQLGFWRLLTVYNLKYFFWRPSLVSLFNRRFASQKKLFYTVLVGHYDILNEIPEKLKNWDYVCYTDNVDLKSSSWEIRPIDTDLDLDPVRLSRYYKINNHLVDTGYDLSVYTDANIRIRGNLDTYLAHALVPGSSFSILMHPFLHSLEQEVNYCIDGDKDDETRLRDQYNHYLARGYQDQFPHINARMMIRTVGDTSIKTMMETWFDQLQRWSGRDQVCFNYSLSRCPDVRLEYIPYWIFRRYFKKMDHQ